MALARIGTVNSVCGGLVSDYAFELGLSPELRVLDEEAAEEAFEKALSSKVGSTQDESGEVNAGSDAVQALLDLEDRMPGLQWLECVRAIAGHARSNRLGPEELRATAGRSLAGLMSHLPQPDSDGEPLERAVCDALQAFIEHPQLDSTKKTGEVVDAGRMFLNELAEGRFPAWSDWAALARRASNVGQKSSRFYGPVVAAVHAIERHPRLHEDMATAVTQMYELAAQAIEDYQAYKRDWGLMDFQDQERHALDLLERSHVREQLRGEFDLVLVDEFQDTSPLQLAVFLALADLAPRSVWVGDQKQAIYGFRGTDPSLMDTVVETLTRANGTALDMLRQSWRSRANLVRLSSEVFATAFVTQGIPPERVRLEPSPVTPEHDELGACVEVWRLQNASRAKQPEIDALVRGVGDLLADEATLVRDRSSGETRRAEMRDVAVLCRRNRDAVRVADALEAAGFDAVIGRPGLMATLEARVVLAALRLWVNKHDRFAATELGRVVAMPGDAAAWFSRLLAHPESAFMDLPEVQRVAAARVATPAAGVLAAFDTALEAVGVRELCLRWGHSEQRLANLDALRGHALDYLTRCADDQATPTLPGLIVALQALAGDQDDEQATAGRRDAISLTTLHGAKGLEWPIVILYGLDRLYEPDPFGVHVMPNEQGFTFDAPLAGRWLRYWLDPFAGKPNPYGGPTSHSGMPMHESVRGSEEYDLTARRERRELLRLLYVGWTRARDRVVLAAKAEKLLAHQWGTMVDTEGRLILSEPETSGPVTWAGHEVEVTVRDLTAAPVPPVPATPGSGFVVRAPRSFAPAQVSPSAIEVVGRAGAPERLGPPLEVVWSEDYFELGDACHAFLAGERPEDTDADRQRMASEQFEAFGVEGRVSPGRMAAAAVAFRSWIEGRWPAAVWHREWPLAARTPEGSTLRGFADLVLETADGYVVLDHKCLSGGLDSALAAAAAYHGQLDAYAGVIGRATGRPVLSRWIHLPFQGVVVEVSSAS